MPAVERPWRCWCTASHLASVLGERKWLPGFVEEAILSEEDARSVKDEVDDLADGVGRLALVDPVVEDTAGGQPDVRVVCQFRLGL